MPEIRTTKIDGQEFVSLKDYLRLKEEKQELEYLGDIYEELKDFSQEQADLLFLIRNLVYNTNLSNEERVEKIGTAVDKFYDKYENDKDTTTE